MTRRLLAAGGAAAFAAAAGAGLAPAMAAAPTVAAAPAAGLAGAPLELAQNLESTIIPDPSRVQGYSLGYPKRRPGLWEIRNASGDSLGMPPTSYCVGDRTDTQENHLDRAAGQKGSCTIGSFKLVGISWVAESVCKDSRSVIVSQSIASGDFQTQYRIDTLVFYSPPLANNKREDRESVVARYLGPCGPGQRPGDLVVPGMGVLNMGDGTLKQAPRR